MSIIAIIPARGGSKRIPNKNIKSFAGQPIISYSIKAAQDTDLFDRIIVSTDSEKIAKVAKTCGAEVPFMRPAKLADDYTPTVPVLKHAVNWLMSHNYIVEYFCCIYSNPFVTSENIMNAFKLIKEKKVSSVIPVTTFPFSIYRGFEINEKGVLEFIFPEHSLARSQDLSELYHDVGQFYWCDCKRIMAAKSILQPDTVPLIIPRHLSQDLDTLEDWEIAEKLYRAFMVKK